MKTKAGVLAAATVCAAAVLVAGADYATYAATGDSVILGRTNHASGSTEIVKRGTGPALRAEHGGTAGPSFAVSSAAKVPNLNADRLDGRTAADLATNVVTYSAGARGDELPGGALDVAAAGETGPLPGQLQGLLGAGRGPVRRVGRRDLRSWPISARSAPARRSTPRVRRAPGSSSPHCCPDRRRSGSPRATTRAWFARRHPTAWCSSSRRGPRGSRWTVARWSGSTPPLAGSERVPGVARSRLTGESLVRSGGSQADRRAVLRRRSLPGQPSRCRRVASGRARSPRRGTSRPARGRRPPVSTKPSGSTPSAAPTACSGSSTTNARRAGRSRPRWPPPRGRGPRGVRRRRRSAPSRPAASASGPAAYGTCGRR